MLNAKFGDNPLNKVRVQNIFKTTSKASKNLIKGKAWLTSGLSHLFIFKVIIQ